MFGDGGAVQIEGQQFYSAHGVSSFSPPGRGFPGDIIPHPARGRHPLGKKFYIFIAPGGITCYNTVSENRASLDF